MCEVITISKHIVRLGTRTYQQKIEALRPQGYSLTRLRILNRDLENFYDLLYNQFNSISLSDYETFGEQLTQLVNTVFELKDLFDNFTLPTNVKIEVERLERNYSALHELNSDIIQFRLNQPSQKLKDLLSQASQVIKSIAV